LTVVDSESMNVSVIKWKFFKLLETSSVLGWQALRTGSFLLFWYSHFASGTSQARSLTQLGLWLLFRRSHAAVF